MKIPHQTEIQLLARSIFHWLNYVETVSKSQLLLESSVRYPLAEYIERQVQAEVTLEEPHPRFDGHFLDFVYKKNKRLRNIELKFLHEYSNDTNERQRIFNDLIRLSVLKDKGYFILCGNKVDFNNIIAYTPEVIDGKNMPDGRVVRSKRRNDFSKWLPLEYNKEPLSFQTASFPRYIQRFSNYYNSFPDELEVVNVQLAAKCDRDASQVVYIWRVF